MDQLLKRSHYRPRPTSQGKVSSNFMTNGIAAMKPAAAAASSSAHRLRICSSAAVLRGGLDKRNSYSSDTSGAPVLSAPARDFDFSPYVVSRRNHTAYVRDRKMSQDTKARVKDTYLVSQCEASKRHRLDTPLSSSRDAAELAYCLSDSSDNDPMPSKMQSAKTALHPSRPERAPSSIKKSLNSQSRLANEKKRTDDVFGPPSRSGVSNSEITNHHIIFKLSSESTSCARQDEQEGEHDAMSSSNAQQPQHEQQPQQQLTLSAFRRPETAIRLTDADPSSSIHESYDLTSQSRTLGHGASSTVRLARRRSDEALVAIKTVAKHDVLRDAARNGRKPKNRLDEVDILANLKGDPGVVQLLDVFETDSEVQLVLEYCAGGELFDSIRRRRSRIGGTGSGYSEYEAAGILSQLLAVLSNLHDKHVVHRDVKPENVLLLHEEKEDRRSGVPIVKLSDFGLARVLRHHPHDEAEDDGHLCCSDDNGGDMTPPSALRRRNRAYSRVGSDYYTAPEVGERSGYNASVDVYSLGVTAYILLCGEPPSSKKSEGTAVVFPDALWSGISKSAKDLVRRMMHPDPACRIGAAEAIRHDWIVQNTAIATPTKTKDKAKTEESSIATPTGITLDCVRSRLFDCRVMEGKKKKRRNSGKTSREGSFDAAASAKRRRVAPPLFRTTQDQPTIQKKKSFIGPAPRFIGPLFPPQVVLEPALSVADLYGRVASAAAEILRASSFSEEDSRDDEDSAMSDVASCAGSDGGPTPSFPTAIKVLSV